MAYIKTIMKISVIVPVWNGEKYLAQCIENLLLQTHKDLEIIVVDDGSTDATASIAAEYPTVKYIRRDNGGNYAARNTGIGAATGDYIHFMDVDDLVNLEFYEKMIGAVVATGADMACCGFVFERFPEQTQRIEHSLVVSTVDDKFTLTGVRRYGACWKYIYRAGFLREHNLLFEERRAAQDRVFSFQAVFYANRIVSVPGAVYIYKNRDESVTTTKKMQSVKKRHEDRKAAAEFIERFARENNIRLDKK